MDSHKRAGSKVRESSGLFNERAQANFPYWTEKVLSGKGLKHFWRGDSPPTLVDPSPVWNYLIKMLDEGARIPVPFAHFAWRPMEQLWLETKADVEFRRDPTRWERRELQDMLIELLLKEQDEGRPVATVKHGLRSRRLKTKGVQTEVAFKDLAYFGREIAEIKRMRDLESKQRQAESLASWRR